LGPIAARGLGRTFPPVWEEVGVSSFFLSVAISRRMIRSSSCLDLDSPIALSSSKNSLDRCIPDMVRGLECCDDRVAVVDWVVVRVGCGGGEGGSFGGGLELV